MSRKDEPFVPDSLDEQLDILSRDRPDQQYATPNAGLIHDLHHLYVAETEEKVMLDAVWERLENYLVHKERSQHPQREQRTLARRPLHSEKEHPRSQEAFSRQSQSAHRFALIAAVLVTALIVSSFAWVLTLAHHGSGNLVAPGTVSSGVYVGTSGGIYRTDGPTGKVLWRYLLPSASVNGGYVPISALKLVTAGGTVYSAITVGLPTKTFILALDATTGQVRWKRAFATGSNLSDMTMASGVLYASIIPPSNRLADGATYALNPADGTISASYPVAGDITVVNQVLYSTGAGISAVRLTTRQVLWHISPVAGVMLQAPHVVNSILYTSAWFAVDRTHFEGFASAFDASAGTKMWQSPLMSGMVSAVTVANAVLYVGSQHRLYAYDTQFGHLLWNQKIDGVIEQAPLVVGSVVYVAVATYGQAGNSCAMMALQTQHGRELWTSLIGGGNVLTGPIIANNVVYVANVTTYALKSEDGAKMWQASITDPNLSESIVIAAVA